VTHKLGIEPGSPDPKPNELPTKPPFLPTERLPEADLYLNNPHCQRYDFRVKNKFSSYCKQKIQAYRDDCFYFIGVRCPVPPILPHGEYVIVSGSDAYHTSTEIRYNCEKGYTLEGTGSMKCSLTDGLGAHWEGEMPTCKGEVSFSHTLTMIT